ncbi:hypothetical protein AAFF_G00226310 [Aldrovandia affinis]|uniref:Uncharacterized protein n=1 Tax=Aldrovandia affinis TaxID=143900 RepID=A0AAD7TBM3_9TELE|nr:hypothetical protein AAFF_G00226310 [Aldrovandia affinis]
MLDTGGVGAHRVQPSMARCLRGELLVGGVRNKRACLSGPPRECTAMQAELAGPRETGTLKIGPQIRDTGLEKQSLYGTRLPEASLSEVAPLPLS